MREEVARFDAERIDVWLPLLEEPGTKSRDPWRPFPMRPIEVNVQVLRGLV